MGLFNLSAPNLMENFKRAKAWVSEQFEPAPSFEATAVTAGDPAGGARGASNSGGPAADAIPASDHFSSADAPPKSAPMTSPVAPRLFSDSATSDMAMASTNVPTEIPGNMPTEVPGNGGGTPTEASGNARGIPTEATGPRTEPMEPPVEGAGGAGSSTPRENVTRPDCPQPNTGPKHDTIPDAPPQGPGLRTAWEGMKTPEAEEYGNRTRGIGSPPVPKGLERYLPGVVILGGVLIYSQVSFTAQNLQQGAARDWESFKSASRDAAAHPTPTTFMAAAGAGALMLMSLLPVTAAAL